MQRAQRRRTNQKLALAAIASVTLLAPHAAAAPNIVFILADDLGWSDTSNGRTNLGNPSDYYSTPCLERLAREGVCFTSAYTNGPNCAPTRAALLTGQYAPRPTNNVYNVGNLNRGGDGTPLVGPPQGLPSGDDAIPRHAFTVAEMLRSAGYRTAHFGKFHVAAAGTAASDIVEHHGFDENFGGNKHGSPGAYHAMGGVFSDKMSPTLDPFGADYTRAYIDERVKPFSHNANEAEADALVGSAKHVSDALTDAAISFMRGVGETPFYVQLHHYAVHTPIGAKQARRDLLAKYREKPKGEMDSNASFGALIEGVDQSVARVLEFLECAEDPRRPRHRLAENTLLIFTSDNGGSQPQSNNGPLRGQKGELREGGIRVPLIVWSRNRELIDGGTINDTPVMGADFFPTFASLSGASLPAGKVLDGKDVSPLFADSDADLDRENLFWHFPGYLVDRRNQRPQSAIRQGNWKLYYNYEDQSCELYDLKNDIGEQNDLTGQRTEIVSRLSRRLARWLDEMDAPLATLRSGTMRITVDGAYYAGGQIHQAAGELLIEAGDEVPFCLR